ncbi:hypothetical protein KCP75_06610 [Salmonella enterica subsp. enterica]|nr:hypothetical protein KCP75_06610 [Salmonella enterica subsp. enterica]
MQNRSTLARTASVCIKRHARYGATVILLGRNEEKPRRVAQHIADEQHVQPQWFTPSFHDLHCRARRPHAAHLSLAYASCTMPVTGEIGPMSEQDPQIWQDVMQVKR